MNFPYTYEEAYYDPLAQFINISKIKKTHFLENIKEPLNLKNFKPISIYLHEFRHWIDHIGTLWGQRFLIEGYRRYSDILQNRTRVIDIKNPFQIHRILREKSLDKLFEKQKIKENSKIWSMKAEIEFIDGVVFWVVNFNDSVGKKIYKSPITFMSLWEANAINEEIQYYLYASRLKNSEEENYMEDLRLQRKYFELAYNSELIEYSIATHLPAGILEVPHSFKAYYISSSISTLLLNLPYKYYEIIAKNNKFKASHRFHYYLSINKDFGYLYWLLLHNYKEKRKIKDKFSFEEFLSVSYLPNQEQIEREVLEEMKLNKKALEERSIFTKKLEENINNGISIFKQRGLDGRKKPLIEFVLDNKIRPPLIFNDGEPWDSKEFDSLRSMDIDKMNFKEWIDFIGYIRLKDKVLKENFN